MRLLLLILVLQYSLISGLSIWTYECQNNYCVRLNASSTATSQVSLAECNILCVDAGGLWPKPTGTVSIANLTEINPDLFSFESPQSNSNISTLIEQAIAIFTDQIRKLKPCRSFLKSKKLDLASVSIKLDISDHNVNILSLKTNESYSLIISPGDNSNVIEVTITADTYFGARHGLETLTQLVVFDDINQRTLLPNTVSIWDEPKYSWRGISLDTSRNYISPRVIKRTLKAMAASKLNTLHWHLTDTASFPYVSKSRPELSEIGAYSSKKVYDDKIVTSIINYANIRGIRVVPELDAPAHVGEGWQRTGLVTCFDWHPWQSYCAEPPCGQLDPSQSLVYDYLEDIYGDLLDQFGSEIFHMGGDEVNINCWNNTKTLTDWMQDDMNWNLTNNGFMNAWTYFQTEAESRLAKKAGKNIPVILWNSDLTAMDDVHNTFSPDNHIIQVWSSSTDSLITELLDKNYTIIISNSDALYLDCGLSSWVDTGNNWCDPYKGWQLIYDNKPLKIAGTRTDQVLGGEVVLWTEESGSSSVDVRLWPRAAAFAETLWTEPSTNWKAAETRMLLHRERLVNLGIGADNLQPEWCWRNPETCAIRGARNKAS